MVGQSLGDSPPTCTKEVHDSANNLQSGKLLIAHTPRNRLPPSQIDYRNSLYDNFLKPYSGLGKFNNAIKLTTLLPSISSNLGFECKRVVFKASVYLNLPGII